jgi:hypothetical protein
LAKTTPVTHLQQVCVLILLHVCPHTATYASSYYYICVLILLHMCPHTTTSVSSYYYICVLMPTPDTSNTYAVRHT